MTENEMAAIEQNIKIEVEEVKVETAEVNGIEQNNWGLAAKGGDERTGSIVGLQRIKDEHDFVEAGSHMDVLEMQDTKIKVEEYWEDSKPFEPMYITKEDISKHENIDENTKIALNSGPEQEIQSQHLVVCKGSSCDNLCFKSETPEIVEACSNLSICIHCNATYKSKQKLDNHIIREHPDSIASISSKIHKCEYCEYKTTVKSNLTQHMIQHTETADTYKLRCMHCDGTFKRRTDLDEHTIKKHPHMIASVTRKIHKCTYCAYQTVLKHHFVRHMLKHPETVDNYELKVCVHCNAKFKTKGSLDNHTVRKHSEFVASVAHKLLECAHCTFVTVTKANLDRHMLKHSKSAGSYKLSICVHCKATYKSKQILDYHIIRKHPDSIASISSKVHECSYCTFKTTLKSNLTKHVIQHTETKPRCTHCDETFKQRTDLDEHIIRKHPHLIASVTSKILECTYCAFKTVLKPHFARHTTLKHSEVVDKLKICVHCNAKFKTKVSLDNHTIREHPDFLASVSNKLHECTHCTYKTTLKCNFSKHVRKHSKAVLHI